MIEVTVAILLDPDQYAGGLSTNRAAHVVAGLLKEVTADTDGIRIVDSVALGRKQAEEWRQGGALVTLGLPGDE